MKNIFSCNYTSIVEDGQSASMPAERYITRTVSLEASKTNEELNERLEQQSKKGSLPLYAKIISYVSDFISAIGVIGYLRSGVSLSEALQNAPLIIYGTLFFIILAVALHLTDYILGKKVSSSEEFKSLQEDLDKAETDNKQELGIPNNAPEVDVLCEVYKMKSNKPSKKFDFEFIPSIMYAYTDDKQLHLADEENVYSFDKSFFTEIKLVKKKSTLSAWTKDEAPASEKYGEYKAKINANTGYTTIQSHYSFCFTDGFYDGEILIPNYDAQVIASLLSLPLPTEETSD